MPQSARSVLAVTFPLAILAAGPVAGQVKASERSTVIQHISGTEIEIDYSRPSVRGRDSLFGTQIPWGDVWTPGADQSTTIRVSKHFSLNGHELEAGRYGLWMQVNPDDNWVVMLHRDTTKYHAPHPNLDEGFLTFPVVAEHVGDFKETLNFDFQSVRANGADIQMHWGDTRVSMHIEVDPGFEMRVAPDEAARLTGEWLLQRVLSQPDSVVAQWKADMTEEQIADFDRYYAPTPLEFRYDDTSGYLYVFETRPDDDDIADYIMLPRGAGMYAQGYLMNGELAFAQEGGGFWEFEFGENGTATTFTIRGRNDRALGHATRTGH